MRLCSTLLRLPRRSLAAGPKAITARPNAATAARSPALVLPLLLLPKRCRSDLLGSLDLTHVIAPTVRLNAPSLLATYCLVHYAVGTGTFNSRYARTRETHDQASPPKAPKESATCRVKRFVPAGNVYHCHWLPVCLP